MKFVQRMKYLQFFIKLRNFLLPCICCLFRGKNPNVYVLVLYGKNFDVTRTQLCLHTDGVDWLDVLFSVCGFIIFQYIDFKGLHRRSTC